MNPQVLCDGRIRVTVDGFRDRTLFVINDGATIRFWTDTSLLERVASGEPIQMSALGGYCSIEVVDEVANLNFAADGHKREHCEFPAQDLADALVRVRNSKPPEE